MPFSFSFFLKKHRLLLAAGLLASACTYDKGKGEATPCGLTAAAPATYARDIQPIFAANCLRCHSAGEYLNAGGGHNFDDFAVVQERVRDGSMLRAVQWTADTPPEVRMPRPAGSRLSECDVARIASWIAAGGAKN